jgi:hypothetical protein
VSEVAAIDAQDWEALRQLLKDKLRDVVASAFAACDSCDWPVLRADVKQIQNTCATLLPLLEQAADGKPHLLRWVAEVRQELVKVQEALEQALLLEKLGLQPRAV